MARFLKIVLTIALWMVSISVAQAHEVVDVKDGGSIKGLISFKGTVPPDEVIAIDKNTEYCGKEHMADKYIVSDSKVKNAVVWIEGVTKGKALPKSEVDVTISKCKAVPHVAVGFVGGEFVFKNDDDILHTVQSKLGLAYQKKVSARPLQDGASIYNLALPKKGLEVRKPIKKWHRYTDETGYIQVRSNTHNWIRGYIFIFDQPYATVTDGKGAFAIDNLPAGEYTLKVWHEGFGTQEKKINVKSGEALNVDIAFGK